MVDWLNFLVRTATAWVIGFSAVDLIEWLLNKKAEIEKKPDDDQKACSDTLEECLRNIRATIEASYTIRTLNDEKLVSDINECLSDIKKLIE